MRKWIPATIILAGLMTMTCQAEWVTAKEGLRVRKDMTTESEVVDVLPFATEVTGTLKDGWLHIEDGYVKAEYLADRDPLSDYEYMGEWLTTAYTHTGACCFDGSYPTAGYTVACNSLEIGSELYIEGVGFRTVCDRGPSSMPSQWCDVFVDTYEQAVAFGEQYHKVWVTKRP